MADKRFDPDDPMEFIGVGVNSDAEGFRTMTEAIIEEYLLMGWSEEQVLEMFRQPFYQLPYAIRQHKGEPYVREAIARVRRLWTEGGV